MHENIEAIFENGVFRPLTPVALPEHKRVSMSVELCPDAESAVSAPSDAIERQRAALARLQAEMDVLPPAAPADGLGGADHDQILYGWTK
jgi:predicted DNA-binding antitoxin AbrB/MazE fold protein